MGQSGVSPEKRLLDIIEKQGEKSGAGSAFDKGKKYFSLGSLRGRISFFKDKILQLGKVKKKSVSTDIKVVNAFLKLAIIILVAGLMISIKIGNNSIKKDEGASSSGLNSTAQAAIVPVVSLLQPQEYYIGKTKNRNLFEFADKPIEVIPDIAEEVKKVSILQEMVKDLKLVGISWSDKPDAIVEDEKMGKTYFIQLGSMIGDIRVREILKDRVILRYEGEEVELR